MKVTILLLFVVSISYSQANFIEEGESAGYGSVSLFSGGGQTDLILSGGFSANGLFDFAASIQRATFDEDYGLSNAQVLNLDAKFRYFIIKQDDLPVQLGLKLIGGVGRLTSKETDALDWDLTSRNFVIGADAYINIESRSNVAFQPFASINYGIQNINTDTNNFGSDDESFTNIYLLIGGSIILDLDYNQVVIAPEIVIGESHTRFGVTFAYIFK